MDIQKFLEGLDSLFAKGAIDEVEPYFQENMSQAEQEQDISSRITILNEMMGFYRETSQYNKARMAIQQVLELIEVSGLSDSLPHATTLLNSANALRAAGDLEQAMNYYSQVFALFEGRVPQMDFRYAELYNNVALLYQELGRYDMAMQSLRNALVIVEQMPGKEFQTAVTLTNLGASALQCRDSQGESFLRRAIAIFRTLEVEDTHMAAALAAMGDWNCQKQDFEQAIAYYEQAMGMIERYVGRTEAYTRVEEKLYQARKQLQSDKAGEIQRHVKGLELSRKFYEDYGADKLHTQFPEYEARIAVGFVGEGSDRFGFDDAFSEDHDYGVGFSMWLTDEDYERIGLELQNAYEGWGADYKKNVLRETGTGIKESNLWTEHSKGRFGVRKISDFYLSLTGCEQGPVEESDWGLVAESRLAAAVNGEVFFDKLGEFSRIRKQILGYYPGKTWLQKLAQTISLFSQYGQYNYPRMAKRNDWVAAELMRFKALEHALHSVYLINRRFCPHDKWLNQGIYGFEFCESVKSVANQLIATDLKNIEENQQLFEQIAASLLEGMIAQGIVYARTKGDILYLEQYGEPLAEEAEWYDSTVEELAEQIAVLEFQAFDKVQNEGGRAGCQDDWHTFRIMRMSQYLTWNREMLIQYRLDFEGNLSEGWNLITEKYGRMMESTAPEEYAKLLPAFPQVSDEKRRIVDEIVKLQVNWMEEFERKCPKLAKNARSIHTSEDTPWNTSYETYLRGELLTYSDNMLVMYGRFVAQLARENKNLAEMTMEHTVLLYGYAGLKEAEQAL
ncbi:MAG: DUF4125 family protein [Lachnospiraceae bacterium]|nr:DUF4125 family protein [Lachnospiraceae bacterium]